MKTLRELREKTLTPAEKKKREEIAKAIEKDNPDMPMDKKMAIATATAKRVAEEKSVRQLIDPKKEVMVVKMNGKRHKVIVIDKSKEKEYLSKGWMLAEEVELDEDRKGMAKLAGLYSKAMRQMPGSPAQKKIKAEIDKLRKELGMNESTEYLEEATDLYNKGGIQIVRFAAGKGKVGVEITVKKGTSPSEIGGQIILSDTQFKNLQRALPKINLRKGLGESLEEQKDDAEYNDEGGMALSQLKTAKSAVEQLMSIIKDNDNLPEWVQSKLTKAVDYMDSVRDYMSSEKDGVQEAVKTTHVVIDTADGNKVVATASSEQGAKSSVASAERPPMNIKNKKTLKIVKLKRPVGDKQVDRMVGYPLKEGTWTLPDSPQKKAGLKKVMSKPIILGKGGEKAYSVIRAYIGDDELYDALGDAGDKNPKGDARPIITKWMKKNFVGSRSKYAIEQVKEAVSPAQQAAIAIAKKEKGEKPKEESRAYRDAMRGMKGNTKGMATTKKDKDTEATDDDRKAASKNIIMQLRKAADLPKGAEIDFERGKGKVTRDQAKATLARFNALSKPREREKMQKSIKSLSDIKKILGR